MIHTYDEAVAFIKSFLQKGARLSPEDYPKKLVRMRTFLEYLGNPDRTYKTIHIGGTSGKGSTAYIAAQILKAAGLRVGLHTQPYLGFFEEKIIVNGAPIAKDDLVARVNECLDPIEKLKNSSLGLGPNFYFPLSSTLAFLAFARARVDIAVIEVAMGGEYDPTNVITPKVTLITNVSLDHTEFLGNTVEQIALTKAGIIKAHTPVITAVEQASVRAIIAERARKLQAPLTVFEQDFGVDSVSVDSRGTRFDYWYQNQRLENLRLSAIGAHQAVNAACAITALKNLKDRTLSESAIRRGLQKVLIPGRFEIVQQRPTVILDGAHNPAKITALSRTLTDVYPGRKVIAVIGLVSGRDPYDTLAPLIPLTERIVLTYPVLQGRDPISLAELESVVAKLGQENIALVEDPFTALALALKEARVDNILLVTGSFYLVGPLRTKFVERQMNPII